MRKKEIEKLEVDIAREKDPEVAERLKAILRAKQSEREEWKLPLKRSSQALHRFALALRESSRLAEKAFFFLFGVFAWLGAIVLLVAIVSRAVEPGSGPFPLNVFEQLEQTKADLCVFYTLCGLGTIVCAAVGWLLIRNALRPIRRVT